MKHLTERRIMDYAASMLERLLILGRPLPRAYQWRVKSAIKLLRHPPAKKLKWMRG